MNLLLFDMDGVLLKPQGYHRALKETVRMAGISAGIGEVVLTDEQIAQFEALGISSEWHSSSLCMAMMVLLKQKYPIRENEPSIPVILDLEDLFEAIAAQPIRNSAINRGVGAIKSLAATYGLPGLEASAMVEESESIKHSPTTNWFQELILGSGAYTSTFLKEAQFHTEGYLMLFDEKLINGYLAENVIAWADQKDCGASIMTNRPSRGLSGSQGAPDAEMGALLAGFETMPLVGYGEVSWLADYSHREVGELSKPGWAHALSAILVAGGWSMKESLIFVSQALNLQRWDGLDHLRDCTVTVFEDTPSGVVAVQEAGALLNNQGLNLEVKKIGIAEDPVKQSALSAQGATIFPDINVALTSLDNFGTFPSNRYL
jgi:beta-phosphoglucomutase-like phosphatase (HAD superfamily)